MTFRLLSPSTNSLKPPASGPDPSFSDAHAPCDVGKQLKTLLLEAKGQLEMPVAQATLEVMRENAEKVGLRAEAVAENFMGGEEGLGAGW